MNCECIFRYKPDPEHPGKPLELGRAISADVSNNIELYPVTISVITAKTKATANYDGGRCYTLRPGDIVLFVGGKYHHMNKTTIRPYLHGNNKKLLQDFEILFPKSHEIFFRDTYEFEE